MKLSRTKIILIAVAIFSLTFGEVWGVASYAQNVGINTTGNAPNSSALLDVNASPGNNKGVLIPRLPLTATNSGTPISPLPGVAETGLMVFNTATAGVPPNDVVPGFYYWNGTAWAPLGAGGSTAGGWTDDGTVVRLTTSTDFVGIGTASPASTSALDITSTTKGILIPRMTTAQRDAITTPATGLQVYNTDCKVVDYWSGTCWISMSKSLPSPGAITSSGTTVFCAGQSRTYTIAAIAGATSYTWTVPAGTTINSGQGTTSISATFGNISGSVCVNANNACETSGQSCLAVSVDPIPNTPGNITGPSSINPGQQSVNYFIASVNGASAYTWAYSGTGLTIASGTGTTSVVVNFACNATAGNLTVTANSTCGASTASSLALTVTPFPAANAGTNLTGPGVIGGSPTATGGTSPYTYVWNSTSGLSSSTIANPTATACTTTTYTVTVTDARSCTATSSVTVTKNLAASAGADKTGPGAVIGGSPTAAGGVSPYTYLWNPTTNLSSSTIANPTANNCTATTYTVTVTDANSCTAASVGVTVTPVTPSQIAYTTPGTFSWTCPAGVTSVCVVAVGGGGGGGYQWSSGGGGGGGLGWKNNISVTPGTAYTVVVGAGGTVQPNAYNNGTQGGNSYFISLGTVAGYGSGRGGTLGETTVSPAYGGGYNGDGGGSGGRGAIGGSWTHAGAGAGGYAGKGGSLNEGNFQGAGGGGAGGGYYSSTYGVSAGGGTGLLGQGTSGTTRYDPTNGWASTYGGGAGGSGGTRGKYGEWNGGTNECGGTQCITGGAPGGGGGGSGTSWGGGAGGAGGVRIIWGCGRSFPSTSTGDL